MTSISKTILAISGISLLATVAASAAVYSQNFTFPDGTNVLGDGTIIASNDGLASVQGGALRISSDSIQGQASVFKIPGLANASLGWTATFSFSMSDVPGESAPADGFSFSWGTGVPFDASLSPHPSGPENGWNPGSDHLNFQFDVWDSGGGEWGTSIGTGTTALVADNQGMLYPDGGSANGTATLSWSPVNGVSFTTTGFVTNANFVNVPVTGFTPSDAGVFAFAARTGFADQTILIDNLVITTVPESSTTLLGALAGLGLLAVRRRK